MHSQVNSNIFSVPSVEPIDALSGFNSTIKTVSDLAKYLYDSGFRPGDSNTSTEAKDYLTTLKTASQNMKSSLNSLMRTTNDSVYKQSTPTSSDTTKLTLDTSGVTAGAGFNTVDINIDQIATQQINQSTALSANASAGGANAYEFSIQKDGKTYQFSVAATNQDTNKTILDKVAAAINEKDIGVTAKVNLTNLNSISTLALQSSKTGENSQFTVTDTFGDLTARTGMDTITQQARDAIYRINDGDQKTSASNTIDLGNGVKATMLKASSETVSVSMKADSTGAHKAINNFINSYNDLVSAAKGSDTTKALQLNYKLAQTVNTYAASLNRIGITMDTNGKMSVNQDKLNSAVQNGDLENLFTLDRNSSYGFANRMSGLASEISSNPMKYTDLSNIGLYNYTNNPYSPVHTLRYSQAYNTGLFLNMFV